jgi:cobalt-zinc-cadmium efflux system outer membrane protein
MKLKTYAVCCVAAWLAGPVLSLAAEPSAVNQSATQALAAYLPAEAAARDALLSSPWMQAARAEKDGWSARAKVMGAGPHEFTVRSTSQRRQDVANGTRWHESMVSVETPLRFWGKRGLDADLEDKTQAYAELGYADAMHEGGRELIQLWFAYLNALAAEQNASTALDLTTKMQRMTQVQLKHGEVSKLDAELASAEHERTQAALAVAQAQRVSAAAMLQRRFPALALPSASVLRDAPSLPTLAGSMGEMRQTYVDKNHELNLMRLQAQRLRLSADRASRERLPDPTVGVFSSRDKGGAETVNGVLLSVPLPGSAKWYHHSAAVADAQAASDKVALAEQQKSAAFEGLWAAYQNKRNAADQLKSAAQRQTIAADKSLKAYSLGEGSLADVLLIARMASDNLHAAQRMQLEVAELYALIRLDLHEMWDFDE